MVERKFSELPSVFGAMADRAEKLNPVLKTRAKAYKREIIDEAFDSETSPLGAPWEPLAPSTIEKKGHGNILFDTGALEKGAGVNVTKTGIRATVKGPAREYAGTHLFGSPAKKIPSRPWIPMTKTGKISFASGPAKKWLARTIKTIQQYILTGKK